MSEEPCPLCGERNPIDTTFCSFCHAYLGWDDEDEPTRPVLVDEPVLERLRIERVIEEPVPEPPAGPAYPDLPPPPPEATARIQAPSRAGGHPELDPDGAVQTAIAQHEVVVTPGAAPGTVSVRVSNTSTIVEAYDIAVVRPPPWLQVVPGRVQLLPGTDEVVPVHLSIRAEDLVPVQRARLRLRIQGESAVGLRRDASVDLVVGAVAAPLELRLEPSTLRARDTTTALFRVIVDNRRSNQPARVHLSGSDPELAATFRFTPPELDVPPGQAVAARVRVDAPLPEQGEQLTRTLTVIASDGRQEQETRGTFVQSTRAPVVDPPVTLLLDPSTTKVENASVGHASIVLDNRRGTRPQRVSLSAGDDERAVQFTIAPDRLTVAAGQSAMARVTMRAPRPDGGQEFVRDFTVTAWNGEEVTEARGRFVQSSSDRRPMTRAALTTLGSAGIALGTVLPWTSNPELTGHGWGIFAVNDALRINDDPLARSLERAQVLGLVDTLVSGGVIALLLAVVALFGLTGQTGRLTRVAALLCLIFVLLLLGALNVLSSAGIGVGAVVVLLGCVTAFAGGLLARR